PHTGHGNGDPEVGGRYGADGKRAAEWWIALPEHEGNLKEDYKEPEGESPQPAKTAKTAKAPSPINLGSLGSLGSGSKAKRQVVPLRKPTASPASPSSLGPPEEGP